MTLIIDQNEDRNHPEIKTLLQAAGVPCDVGNTNQSPGQSWGYPDFLIWETGTGINRKTVSEWLSSTDKVIEQVQRELAGPINHLALIIEGIMHPNDDRSMYGYDLDWNHAKYFQLGYGSVPVHRRPYNVNPKHVQNEQTRLEFLGVQILHTYDLSDTVSKLVAFHEMMLKGEPNNVLNKLRKSDIHIQGLSPAETAFAKTLMGIQGANIGEEIALTLAAHYSNIMELVGIWQEGGTIADLMLRSGTRRVGTAAELRLQRSLGYEASNTRTILVESGLES